MFLDLLLLKLVILVGSFLSQAESIDKYQECILFCLIFLKSQLLLRKSIYRFQFKEAERARAKYKSDHTC